MLLPLINTQKFIKNEVYKNQDIDINFDIIRELPINLLFDNSRYGFHIAGSDKIRRSFFRCKTP